jgi:CelD/BcsL family acetyltransferase involved in cellulose biosynthesis
MVASRIRRSDCRLFDSFDALQPYEAEWDRLAVKCGKPTCRPAWLRAWWEAYCAPADRESRALRVVVVTEDEKLMGLFPGFLVDRNSRCPDLRLLGERHFWSVEPLVSHDALPDTFALFARALSESRPPPARLMVEWAPMQSTWPAEMRRGWSGGPAWLRRSQRGKLQVIEGPLSFETWLAGLPRRHRGDLLRRTRRRAEARLEVLCTETPEAVRDDVQALAQLHQARLNWRSLWLTEGVEQAIVKAGRSLFPSGDFRLWKVLRSGQVIGAALFARAGDVSELLLTAFDPGSSRLAPGLGAIVAGIRHELDTSVRLIDFGYGGATYLRRLANAEHPIVRYELFPTNLRMPIARVRWLRAHSFERVSLWRGQLRLRTRLRAVATRIGNDADRSAQPRR